MPEEVPLLADELDCRLMQGKEIVQVGLVVAHIGVADPPAERLGVVACVATRSESSQPVQKNLYHI